jgi:peptidoglycan LD-endopeptidase CwlK
MFKFSEKSEQLLNTVDKRLVNLAKEVIKISKIDIGISYGLRDLATQQKLFAKGVSQCNGIDKRSKHQDGLAIDFVCYINGEITYDKKYYYYVVGLMQAIATQLNISITCGVWWSFEDCGHIELAN